MSEVENTTAEIENFFNLGNDYFSLKGYGCFTGVDVVNLSPREIKQTLKIQADRENVLHYAFSGSKGLCRTTPMGSVKKENLISELISLPNEVNAIRGFFEENGFLFPVSDAEYEEINLHSLIEIVNHIKATVLLMSEIEEPQRNYEKILYLTLYLLLSEQVSIKLNSMKKPYYTCHHGFAKILEKASSVPEIDGTKEGFESETYTINDLVYKPTFALNIEEYQDIISGSSLTSGYPGMNDLRFKDIVYLYRNAPNETSAARTTIDFLFHLMKKIGVVNKVSFEHGIEFYSDPSIENFDDNLKAALITVSKIVLNEEINSNLSGITPRFLASKMEPSWKASSLLSALYFSIFYMKPGSEIYRECANPSCNNHFLVKTSNGRKKYCSPNCRNATAQRNHRKKVKKMETK
ncbi:MAG: CGNR zinc finger domain-containing protein [Suipraeoptans sp.]